MSIYQHFRKHEHPFVDQVLSWKEQVMRNYIAYETDFLDPREQQIVESLIGTTNDEVLFSFFGGETNAERKRAIIAPFYEEISPSDFAVKLLEATYHSKFIELKHRDILGAFMSLGIDRKKVGDIVVAKDRFQLMVAEELLTYIQMNLTQVKQANIILKEIPFANWITSNDQWIERHHTVSSLRLDILVKEIYQLSRKTAVQLIKANRVKVNFTDVDDPALQMMEEDLISVRGYGRSKVLELHGKTRKDKLRLTSARLKT